MLGFRCVSAWYGRSASWGTIDLLRISINVVDGQARMLTVKQAMKAGTYWTFVSLIEDWNGTGRRSLPDNQHIP